MRAESRKLSFAVLFQYYFSEIPVFAEDLQFIQMYLVCSLKGPYIVASDRFIHSVK